MWMIIFWLKLECVIEEIKLLKVKLSVWDILYRNCIWITRIKIGGKDKNYAETIIAMSKNVISTCSTAKLPNC